MNCQLVRVQTSDNVYLHGLQFQATSEKKLFLDAAICIHGLGGNFYGSRLNLTVGERLAGLGLNVVQINTRGHDDINQASQNGRTVNLGAAFEIVDECRLDINAWIQLLVDQDYQRIVIFGHSLGAIKSIYSQALQPNGSVCAIIAASASRLCYEKFMELPTRDKFLHWVETANSLIRQGKNEDLMRVDFPFPTYITAAAYLDKYGPEDRYNWLKHVQKIDVPTLLAFGDRELVEIPAFVDIIDDIRNLDLNSEVFEIVSIEGANHFYAARQKKLANAIAEWLKNKFPVTP